MKKILISFIVVYIIAITSIYGIVSIAIETTGVPNSSLVNGSGTADLLSSTRTYF